MPVLHIHPNGDGIWADLKEKQETGKLVATETLSVAGLSSGMKSGAPSVAIRIDLPDGRVVFAQTSLSLFLTAADTLKAVHGDPRTTPNTPPDSSSN